MVRIKNRYLLVHILSPDFTPSSALKTSDQALPAVVEFHRPCPDTLDSRLFAQMIREQVSLMYGDYGLGLVSGSLKIIYLSTATSTVIVKVVRDHYRLVWAALSFMTQLPDRTKGPPRACVMRVVRVSGTIKKAEEEAVRRAREAILKARGESGGDGLAALLRKAEGEDGNDSAMMGVDGFDDEDGVTESEGD